VAVAELLPAFAEQVRTDQTLAGLCAESWQLWSRTTDESLRADDPACWGDMRYALLDFIADFANWDASTVLAFLETARALTQAAHEALGGAPDTRPLVVDPFAGGGAIPLEALRVGADAFASDLNPVAVLLNKVVLEYIPRYGQQLADEVRRWGQWVKEQAEAELAQFYPPDPDGATPIAYLWARTVISEAPGETVPVEVPLMRSLWLAKKTGRNRALRWVRDDSGQVQTETVAVTYADGITRTVRRPLLEIFEPQKASEVEDGTVARGAATCPVTGYTTPVESVRRQLKARRGGAADARLFCVVTTKPGKQGRHYRLPTERDTAAVQQAAAELERRIAAHTGELSLVPDEEISLNEIRRISVPIYGMMAWGDVFTPRQLITLTVLTELVNQIDQKCENHLALAVKTCLALGVDRCANQFATISKWNTGRELVDGVFARQALPMLWDFGEINLLGGADGYWSGAIDWILAVFQQVPVTTSVGQAEKTSATAHSLPDYTANAVITDPPYYDAVPYAYLSDFFYVWLRRSLAKDYPILFETAQVPKDEEIVVDRPHELSTSIKDIVFYERELTRAFADSCRITQPHGVGVIVFASKTTSSWEAILKAVIDAGWTMTGSWPIDTEMASRVSAQDQARLASSVHLVCRPRQGESTGEWRDVLQALPQRIGEWMPRLVAEGVVGADAIFACLGPALELFSRYDRVEKASGEEISLQEYLEYVWAAVSREALSTIFQGADTLGFEEDARLTVMWLWTLSAGERSASSNGAAAAEDADDESEITTRPTQQASFALEYDTARKIAQGLGADMAKLASVVEIKGDKARLLAVAERARPLFGKEGVQSATTRSKKKGPQQLNMFDVAQAIDEAGDSPGDLPAVAVGETVLDRLHQSMLLFGAGRGDALRRFLVDDGTGTDQRLWRLAQALSALYPPQSQEKRWVDGVLARKKGLGL
jgi:adenine-specific DNA methylase